jgi:hypothetical protein
VSKPSLPITDPVHGAPETSVAWLQCRASSLLCPATQHSNRRSQSPDATRLLRISNLPHRSTCCVGLTRDIGVKPHLRHSVCREPRPSPSSSGHTRLEQFRSTCDNVSHNSKKPNSPKSQDSPFGTKISCPSSYFQLFKNSKAPLALNLPSLILSPSLATSESRVGYLDPCRDNICLFVRTSHQ